jgi:polyisoprenoid-binding protein YceI
MNALHLLLPHGTLNHRVFLWSTFEKMWMMKSWVLVFSLIVCTNILFAQQQIVSDSSVVNFTIKNLGIKTQGTFSGMKGEVKINEADMTKSSFDVSVDAASINTGIEARDSHLREADYFNVAEFPRITFKSTAVTSAGRNKYKVAGVLTLKGTSKNLEFPFTATRVGNGWLLKGEFTINRRDYNVGGGSMILSDNAVVNLSVVTH